MGFFICPAINPSLKNKQKPKQNVLRNNFTHGKHVGTFPLSHTVFCCSGVVSLWGRIKAQEENVGSVTHYRVLSIEEF